MTYNPAKHHRRSIRLKGHAYSQAGTYYVTVVTHNRECLFGKIVDNEMRMNEYGAAVETEWLKTAEIRANVELDEYVVMPNHFHGIVVIVENGGGKGTPRRGTPRRGTLQRAPTTMEQFAKPVSGSLATTIRSFKSAATTRVNALRDAQGAPVWQRNYYEHIVRDEKNMTRIREYIANNPANWKADKDNPKNIKAL